MCKPVQSQAIPLLVEQDSNNGLFLAGYLRMGAGLSHDHTMVDFKLPGATAKYRLGNEANFYYETRFRYRQQLEQGKLTGNLNFAGFRRYDSNESFELDIVREANLSYQINNSEYWIGRSYNHRKQIHIIDHYFMNTAQGADWGLGVNAVSLADGLFNIAYYQYRDNFNNETLTSRAIDLRWQTSLDDNSKVLYWLYARTRDDNRKLNATDENGYSVGMRIDHKKLFNGKSRMVAFYSQGAAIVQSGINGRPIREQQGWQLSKASIFELSNDWLFENNSFSVNWIFLLRKTDKGLPGKSKIDWYSTGFRPQFYFTERWNIAFEQGIDYVDDQISAQQGWLSKSTIALQYMKKNHFYHRPAYRIFATYAKWSDDFIGQIGGQIFQHQDNGWNLGIQVESWW
jgi:maltoporin